MVINWTELLAQASTATEFSFESDSLADLEIRDAQRADGFHFFYDTRGNRLITDFVLEDRPQVALLCTVTLVHGSEGFSPRIRLWRKDKTKLKKTAAEQAIPGTSDLRMVKASVDTAGGHKNFWKLMSYLLGLAEIDVPREPFSLAPRDSAELARLLASQEKEALLAAVHTALGGDLSDRDISLLANRKEAVSYFGKLLSEPGFFASELERTGKKSEALWQSFFEANSWIFGYGLTLVGHAGLDEDRLEQVTTGRGIFEGGGKRADAVMRSRAVISALLFCEIKRHDTPLLEAEPYRPPDVFRPSKELSGGTAQLQKTVRKALRKFATQIQELTTDDGTPTGVEFSTTRPRQVLLIGDLREFRTDHGVNGEKVESFELYRRSLADVEVITFDELYERARFIAADPEGTQPLG